jgi:hypothetical protein
MLGREHILCTHSLRANNQVRGRSVPRVRANSLQAMRLNQLKPKPETLNPKPKTLQVMQLNQELATVQEQLHCLR